MFIERKAYSLESGDVCWIYTCSCNARRSSLLCLVAANRFGIAFVILNTLNSYLYILL